MKKYLILIAAIVASLAPAQPFVTSQPGLSNHILDAEGRAWRKSGPNKKPSKQFRFLVIAGTTVTPHPDEHKYLIDLVRSCVRDEWRSQVADTWIEGVSGGYFVVIGESGWHRSMSQLAELVMNQGERAAREQLQNEMRSQDLL